MAKRKCNHETRRYTWRRDDEGREVADALFCDVVGCGQRLGMGPSNDEPAAVQVEMRAASLNLSWEGDDSGPMSDEEYQGWGARHFDSIALDSDAQVAGWLSREMRYAGTERDIGVWPWDVSRLLAEQQDEIRLNYDAVGALCDIVKEAGGVMRLHGVPIDAAGLRAAATMSVADRSLADAPSDAPPQSGNDDVMETFTFAAGYMGDPDAWCFCYSEYPDEGAHGPFASKEEAIAYATCILEDSPDRDEDDYAPPPADPVLKAAAARYLESDEGKAQTARRAADPVAPCPRHPLLMAGECLACGLP